MNFEKDPGFSFESYNEDEIQNLIQQGWMIDAEGIDENEAQEMSQMISEENRVFIKEDGTCVILVKQMSAIEDMSQTEQGENPQDLRDEMHNEYYDRLPEVMGDNKQR